MQEEHNHDSITGFNNGYDYQPVRIELINDTNRLSSSDTSNDLDTASITALSETVKLATERIGHLRQLEQNLEDATARENELRLECEQLKNSLADAQELLSKVRQLQQTLDQALET